MSFISLIRFLALTFLFVACKSTMNQSLEKANDDCLVKGLQPPIANLAENTVLYTWTNDPLAMQDVYAFVKKASTGSSGISKEDKGSERVTELNKKILCPMIFDINSTGLDVMDSQRLLGAQLKSKGIMGGFGLYLATDPLTSIMYGRTLVQVTLKSTSIANVSKLNSNTGAQDWQMISKAALSSQPLVGYPWQRGLFGSSPYDFAFVARSSEVVKSARVLVKPSKTRPLLFSEFPDFEKSHQKLEDLLSVAANQGSLFTSALAISDNPDSLAEFAIFSELGSGGLDPKWRSHLGDQCKDDSSCSYILSSALRGAQSEIKLDQTIKALQIAGYLSSTFSAKSPEKVLTAAIHEFQKTQGFKNASSWYRGTVDQLTATKGGLISKPTYLEKLVEN